MKKSLKKVISMVLMLTVIFVVLAKPIVAEKGAAEVSAEKEVDIADRVLEPLIVEEDIEKRTESEKHFLCDDGTYIAVKYPFAVHSFENNEWIDAEYKLISTDKQITPANDNGWASLSVNPGNNLDVVTISAGGYDVSWKVNVLKSIDQISTSNQNLRKNTTGIEQVKFSENVNGVIKTSAQIAEHNKESIINLSKKECEQINLYKNEMKKSINSLKYNLNTLTENSNVIEINKAINEYNRKQILSVSAEQSIVEYNNAFGEGITLRYIYSPQKLNEEIVLASLNDFVAYSMVINTGGLTAAIDIYNKIYLKDENGKTIITIDAPYMYDSDHSISEDIQVSLIQKDDVCTIIYTPNEAWLKSSDRSWPIVIDPGVSTTLLVPQIDQLDNYVYAGQTYAVNSSSPKLIVGYENGVEHWTYWGVQDWIPSLESGASIRDCSFNIRLYNGTGTMGNIGLYFVGGGTLNTSSLTWNNKPALGNLIASKTTFSSDLWLSYSSNALREYMIENNDYSISYVDFALKYTEYKNDFNWFYSADYRPNGSLAFIPYLEVRYGYDYKIIEDGRFYIQNVKSGHYLSVLNDNSTEGAYIVQDSVMTLEPLASQTWEIEYSGGSHRISPMSAQSKTVYWNNDNSAVLSSSLTSYNGKWRFEKNSNGRYVISSVNNPMMVLCVSGASTAEDAYVQISTYTGDDSQKWIITQKPLPLSGSELDYEPELWNYQPVQQNRCYYYAINNQLNNDGSVGSGSRDPGIYAECSEIGQAMSVLRSNVEEFINYVEKDCIAFWGINENNVESVFKEIGQYEQCDPGMYKIAFVYDGDYYTDYHWYRQNSDGTWSHKIGVGEVTNLDSSGELILDPQNANRGKYSVFYKYYAVKPWNNLYYQGG